MVSMPYYTLHFYISNHKGAVIVSTPQDVALSDVRKGIAMLRKVSVPVRIPHLIIVSVIHILR
jgi:hypothetical protein